MIEGEIFRDRHRHGIVNGVSQNRGQTDRPVGERCVVWTRTCSEFATNRPRTSTNSSRFNHSESTERRSIRLCCIPSIRTHWVGQRSLYHRYQLGIITLAVCPSRSLSLHLLTARVLDNSQHLKTWDTTPSSRSSERQVKR